MHYYSTDSKDKDKIMWICIMLSIGSAFATSILIQYLRLESLWWLDVPSVIGFYGLYNYIFDASLWKNRWIRTLLFLDTPNLNGEWEGSVSSSYDGHSDDTKCNLRIKQTLTKIIILFESDLSTGNSISSSILLDDLGCVSLRYEYLNEPKMKAEETMHMHRGTSRLIINENLTMKGDYYNGRDRQQFGTVSFSKKIM